MSARANSTKAFITYMREYSLLWHHIAKGIGMDVVPPKPPDRETIEAAKGCGLDYWCYDLRLIFADMLIGAKNGADLFVVPGGPGTCMLGHAAAALMKPMIERLASKEVSWLIVNINPAVMFRSAFISLLREAKQLCELSGRKDINLINLVRLLRDGLRKVGLYSLLHEFVIEHLHSMRSYSEAMTILREAYNEMLIAESKEAIKLAYARAMNRVKELMLPKEATLKVAIIGDFYTTMLGCFPTFDIVRFISSQLGVQLIWVMNWCSFINPFGGLWGKGNYRKGLRILGQRVTGSDIITVCAALRASHKGADGIIHLSAFGCTPEATAVGALEFFKDAYNLPPICSITFDEHTQPDAIKVRVEAFIDTISFGKRKHISTSRSLKAETKHIIAISSPAGSEDGVLIGIDVGSITAKIVLLDASNLRVVYKAYERTYGNPIETVRRMLSEAGRHCNGKVISVGVTGSGRELIGAFVGADVIRNEVTAHAIAISHKMPDAKTVFEIGGQDSKLILLRDGIPVDFSMNMVCAAGTGAFLDHQAARLGIQVEELGELARRAKKRARISGRCTVFVESDMLLHQQAGQPIEEIIAGLCYALVRNYFSNVISGRAIQAPYVLCGGVAANIAVKDAFEEMLKCDVHIPEHFNVMGAIGAALLSAEASLKETSFRGFELPPLETIAEAFECDGCSNRCVVKCFRMATGREMHIGSMCQRW